MTVDWNKEADELGTSDFLKFTEIIRQIEGFWLQLVKLPRKENMR